MDGPKLKNQVNNKEKPGSTKYELYPRFRFEKYQIFASFTIESPTKISISDVTGQTVIKSSQVQEAIILL